MNSSIDAIRALVEAAFPDLVTVVENREGGYDFRWINETDPAVRVVPTELGVNVHTFTTGRVVWMDAEAKFVGMATAVVAGVVVASLIARVVL